MKKIGIVTIIDNDNYGNRLQNYAVQEILKKRGYEVVTLRNREYSNSKKKYMLRCLRYCWKDNTYSANIDRKRNFEKFNDNIIFSKRKYTPYSKCDYDYVVVGSDQVWNPTFRRLSDVDLLSFVDPSKRISISASFGIANLPSDLDNNISIELSRFKSISVREEAGKSLIEKLTGRKDAEVLIDPTMMLDKKDWMSIAEKPNLDLTKPYIVKYFLSKPNSDIEEKINRIVDEHKLEVVDILNPLNQEMFECGPSEFLYLISNASLICTDSFHACVFSILFEKSFLVFERGEKKTNMGSRITTLLTKFGLSHRLPELLNDTDVFENEYEKSYKILVDERNKVNRFLDEAFAENEDK